VHQQLVGPAEEAAAILVIEPGAAQPGGLAVEVAGDGLGQGRCRQFVEHIGLAAWPR